MEKIIEKDELKIIDSYRTALDKFIGFNDVDLVIDDEIETLCFYPNQRKVAVGSKWIKNLETSEDRAFEELKLKFGIYHEFSHYRDMLKECSLTGNESMLRILTDISKRSIKINDGEKTRNIFLGNIIHNLYNCIDDIVVNTEVGNYISAEISQEDMKSVYQKVLFPDYKKGKDEQAQEKTNQEDFSPDYKKREKEYVDENKKKPELNLDGPVDYSEIPTYKAFPYYFLRKYMVTDQEIILPNVIQSVLFNERGKPETWSKSIKKLTEIFEEKIKESKVSNPDRYAKFEKALTEHLILLKKIKRDQQIIDVNLKRVLVDHLPNGTIIHTSSGKKIKGVDRIISSFFSLEDIIGLFTVTKGMDKDHRLVVSPDKRYEIMEKIFEPVLSTFILMHLLDVDIPDEDINFIKIPGSGDFWIEKEGSEGNGGNGKEGNSGEGGDSGEGSDSGKGSDSGEEGDDGEGGDGSGVGNKIKDLKKIINYKKGEEKKQERKRQKDRVVNTLLDVLKQHGFNDEDAKRAIKSFNNVIENFKEEIRAFTEILKNELKKLELDYKKKKILARKGKRTDYGAIRKQLESHYDDLDLSDERVWEKKKFYESLEQEFKKLVFYFMLDISGSTSSFRGDKGYLNGIAMALAVALHNVEQDIRELIGDPDYSIPTKFVIYSDGAELITCKYNSFDEMLAEANDKIITLDGGTDDRHGWQKSSEVIIKDFNDNETYVEDIENKKMKVMVLQIADTDVTEDGVITFKDKIKNSFGEKSDNILKGIETKRLILGEVRETNRYLSHEEIMNMKGGFKPVPIIDPKTGLPERNEEGKIHVKINEVGVKRKKEIIENVGKLLENLFVNL